MAQDPLKFKVAPHIVQDLGLNLYSSLPRVLVEYVANAYDADSLSAEIRMDFDDIKRARTALKADWEHEKAKASSGEDVVPLAERTLPSDVSIVVEDSGHGMSRTDLQDKFLVAGRRRREDEDTSCRSPGGRILMGRKGLGKLAGFGVAKLIVIETWAKGENHGTRMTLDYDKLIAVQDTNEIPIDDQRMKKGEEFPEGQGTRVILSRLLYEPTKSRKKTIEHLVADHFAQIEPEDLEMRLNGKPVKPTPRNFVWAWPAPELDPNDVVKHTFQGEGSEEVSFVYRLRFVEDRTALTARDRGIRVYAHKRLAASPDLLDADTNMHGFRMTDYLDGVVYADFIDDQPQDYIATDRQTLRWETPLLEPMRAFLSKKITEACRERQRVRDKEKEAEVKKDDFTTALIEEAALNKKEQKAAYKMASAVSSLHKKGTEDEGYKQKVTQVIKAMGEGEILAELARLAELEQPELDRVVAEITRLTAEELSGFFRYVKGRLNGIAAFKRIVEAADFREARNEKTLQRLFKQSPWLIDPMYNHFLSADQSLTTLFGRLAKHLKIGQYAPENSESDSKRPDLVFPIGGRNSDRLVIVELKCVNVPLDNDCLDQLEYYMDRAEGWLEDKGKKVTVRGQLLGSMPDPSSKAQKAVTLRRHIKKAGMEVQWKVRDYLAVLEDAQRAHEELLETASAESNQNAK